MHKVYLDNNATTELDLRVLEAMLLDLKGAPANPSSVHSFGRKARSRLIKARQTIAQCLNVRPNEILFTSGGTESLNTLIRGAFAQGQTGHIITSDIEHSAVYNTVQALEKKGCKATYLKTGLVGAISVSDLEKALTKETRLIVLSAVNSETGVKNDIEAIATIAERAKIPFIVDAVALFGKEAFTIPRGVSALAISGHKLHGPKGIGMSWVHSSFKCEPLLTGGDQEYGKRAGTENLSGILGLAKAIELLSSELPTATERMHTLRDMLESELQKKLGRVHVNGTGPRIVNCSNLAFEGFEGEELLMQLDLAGIAVSHGSACASGALEPSRVLTNMGVPQALARASLRFSLSRLTTPTEITHTINTLCSIIKKNG